ncbi:2OG-Fe(II) oxygenase family protein [Roseibium sp. AS2]|uniref:2OG-Fe(II) oxygenase family protein n=1 Tax=Roseibium sp. AS2 TaxID=3135781 RepID=UPI00317498A8
MQRIARELISKGHAKIRLNAEDVDTLLSVFGSADRFFNQDKAEKAAFRFKSDVEGYREIGAEFSISEDRPDLNEAYGVVLGNIPSTQARGWATGNVLFKSLLDVSKVYQPTINALFEALRQEINPDGAVLEVGDTSYLQVNYYRPSAETRDFLQDHHEDGHLLTVVKALEPGLEIRPDDRFEPVVLERNEILLMPGSLLSIMTGGEIPALWHRVRNTNAQQNRASMMFFVNPCLKEAPAPWKSGPSGQDTDLAAACVERSVAFGLEPIDTAV